MLFQKTIPNLEDQVTCLSVVEKFIEMRPHYEIAFPIIVKTLLSSQVITQESIVNWRNLEESYYKTYLEGEIYIDDLTHQKLIKLEL